MSAQAEYDERRRGDRYEFLQKVYLQDNDVLIGYAQNLNLGGMLLVSDEPLAAFQHYDLWFGADKKEKILDRIFVSAYPVWQKISSDKEHFYSGMRFSHLDELTIEKIRKLIVRLDGV